VDINSDTKAVVKLPPKAHGRDDDYIDTCAIYCCLRKPVYRVINCDGVADEILICEFHLWIVV
jgi:hypothetical protein